MPDPVRLQAPAKINLHLRVFPVGADGFHPLRSWFRTVALFDELNFRLGKELDGSDSLDLIETALAIVEEGADVRLACSDPELATDDSNLALRAAYAYLKRGSIPLDISLDKHMPAGGGLGGGSSDAAAVLVGLDRLFGCRLPFAELAAMAVRLGSDVPFFLHHQIDGITDATCTGRGEIVQPFEPARRHVVLLILPGLHVSTPAVYRQFDAMPPPPDDGAPDFQGWSPLPALELLPLLRNDLEPPAFSLHPDLGRLRADLEQRLGRIVRMTGSGSTLFTLFDDRTDAEAAASGLNRHNVRTLIA